MTAFTLLVFIAAADAKPALTPVPVPPWRQESALDAPSPVRHHETPLECTPPDQETILRAIPIRPNIFYETKRDEIEIVMELIVNRFDPPQCLPFVGRVKRHRSRWKCQVYCVETLSSNWPFPFTYRQRCVEVVYLDRESLHPGEAKSEAPRSIPGHVGE